MTEYINGVAVVEGGPPDAHKDTHDPEDGSDKLDTAVPVKVGSANATGNSHSLARANHVHEREHTKYTDAEVTAVAVARSILDAHSILMAVSDNTPVALAVAASRILGRKSTGNIVALTAAEIRTIINVEDGSTADLTGLEIVALLEALAGGSQLSHDQLDDVSTSDHHTKYSDANARSAAVSDTAYGAGWNGVTTIAPSKNAVYDKIETLGAGGATVATGTYAGNNTQNRQITTGFKCSLVLIVNQTAATNTRMYLLAPDGVNSFAGADRMAWGELHASNGFVVSKSVSFYWMNRSGENYYYWAISE